MDATYKTQRQAVPVFFLVVRTNFRFIPVCTFVTQNEQTVSITEALQIIRDVMLADGFEFRAFMVDKSQAEINAINNVFPGKVTMHMLCKLSFQLRLQPRTIITGREVYICAWHRKRAWAKWLRSSPYRAFEKEIMQLFEGVATAIDEVDVAEAEYALEQSPFYRGDQGMRLRNYWQGWQRCKEVCIAIIHPFHPHTLETLYFHCIFIVFAELVGV